MPHPIPPNLHRRAMRTIRYNMNVNFAVHAVHAPTAWGDTRVTSSTPTRCRNSIRENINRCRRMERRRLSWEILYTVWLFIYHNSICVGTVVVTRIYPFYAAQPFGFSRGLRMPRRPLTGMKVKYAWSSFHLLPLKHCFMFVRVS